MFDHSILDADELLALATLDLQNDKVDAGLIKIKAAMQQDDTPSFAHALIGKVYAQLQLLDKAEHHFKAFLEQHPNALNEQFQLGMVNFDKGQAQNALDIWQQVLQQTPTHPPSLFYSALALLQLEQASEAKRNLDVLMQSAPADNLYFGRAKELLAQINQNEPQVAMPNPADVYGTTQ